MEWLSVVIIPKQPITLKGSKQLGLLSWNIYREESGVRMYLGVILTVFVWCKNRRKNWKISYILTVIISHVIRNLKDCNLESTFITIDLAIWPVCMLFG